MIARGDTVLMISNSGETFELLSLLSTLKRLGIPLISMLGDTRSTLARHSDFILDIGVHREACPWGLAPTASSTAALALGDALALTVAVCKGFKPEEFARLHPGGKLGKRLALVEDLMHRGDQLPLVGRETSMPEVIYEMSRKGLGIAVVCEPGRKPKLLGVISDGDLRRLLQKNREGFLDLSAGDCMTSEPEVIMEGEMAVQALDRMEKKKITSLMVVDGKGLLKGVIHLHDLWGTDLF
jgi:arabinose-5-phosphate isomerase